LPSGGRPFALQPALVLAGVLTLALLVARTGTAWLGGHGAILASGLADAHAGSLAAASLAARGELSAPDAALAISAALGTNTAVKVALAFAAGGADFGWHFAAAIAGAAAAFGVGMVLGRSPCSPTSAARRRPLSAHRCR
jgi:uncharacterized membrane protein (DUF4010 family)